MKISDDTSIFTWVDSKVRPNDSGILCGLLAISIGHFADSHNIVPYRAINRHPFVMTNKGLCINLALRKSPTESYCYIAPLDCRRLDNHKTWPLGIYLKELDRHHRQFIRVEVDCLLPLKRALMETASRALGTLQTIYVPQRISPQGMPSMR
jgi:hypothetical protein